MSAARQQPRQYGAKQMTHKANAQAAFIAVNMGVLAKLDPASISRTSGVPVDQVEAMIKVRRDREAGQ